MPLELTRLEARTLCTLALLWGLGMAVYLLA